MKLAGPVAARLDALRKENVPLRSWLALLEITLEYPTGMPSKFSSNDLFDAEVLKHFGMFKLDNRPVLDGYYPL